MNRLFFPFLFCCAVLLSTWSVRTLYTMHAQDPREEITHLVYLPPSVIKLASLEFAGAASDYLMLKTIVLHGDRLIKEMQLTSEDWEVTFRAVDQIINLDQRFWDPYVLVTMSIPWEEEMVNRANALLLKAAAARPDDHRPYFYLWYHYYQFFRDMESAGKYLRLASEKPGAPLYLATLAARMSLYSGNTKEGVRFLEQMIANTPDNPFKTNWELRAESLRRIVFIEDKVAEYSGLFGKMPRHLQELVREGLLAEIPADPYGGTFFITKDGHVYTTSKLVMVNKKPDNPLSP